MLDIDIADMEIAQQLKVTIPSINREVKNDTLEVATNVEMVILPNNRPNAIAPDGRVIIANAFEGYMITPNDDIKEADYFEHDGTTFFINKVNKIADVQWFELDETYRG